jgi:dCTP deaminase
MILSGINIENERTRGNIIIEPWNPSRLNPNSYNLSLSDELMHYRDTELDMKRKPDPVRLTIPAEGIVLQPGKLYLGRTDEFTETHGFVPMIEGRSSVGRLGMFVHITAGFGDVGFSGFWTLEMMVLQPTRIYAGVEICQIFYHAISENHREYSSGKYQNNTGIQESMLYRDFL